MSNKRFRVGSIVIMFAVVLLCVSIFAALTVVSAIRDRKTAQRYAQQITAVTQCQNLGQRWLAQADACIRGDASVPENTWQEGAQMGTTITQDKIRLVITIACRDDGYEILEWSCAAQWSADDGWQLLQ